MFCSDSFPAEMMQHNILGVINAIIQHTFPFPILSFPPSMSGHKHSVVVEITQHFKFSPDSMKTGDVLASLEH